MNYSLSLPQKVAVLLLLCCGLPAAVWAGPQPVFSLTSIQFGELLQGQTATRTLFITNVGDAAYLITQVSTSQADFSVTPDLGIVEPGDTLALDIKFQPAAGLGIYLADLLIQAISGTTTLPMQGVVVLPTSASFLPDTLRASAPSGSRDTVLLTLSNTGPSGLTYSLSGVTLSGGAGSSFYESFENPLLDRFTSMTGGYLAERIVAADAPNGTRVLSLTGGNYDAQSGIWADITPDTFVYMSYWFKPVSGAGVSSVIRWWNSQEIIVNIWHTAGPDQVTININGAPIQSIPCSSNAWHRLELRNMDHVARRCDVYLDNVLALPALQWNTDLTTARRIQLSNWDYNTAWFDQVRIGSASSQALVIHFPEGSKGVVASGQSRDIPIAFHAEGLETGLYQGEIVVDNNSQNLPMIRVPFQLSVTPGRKLLVRTDTLDLGQVYVGLTAKQPLHWVNVGSESLLVYEVTTSSPLLTIEPKYGIVTGLDSLTTLVGYTAASPGAVLEKITLKSTGGDEEVWVKAVAQYAPSARLSPDSICLTLIQGQDSTVQVQWSNLGLADLEVKMFSTARDLNPTIRVLSAGTSTASRQPAAVLRDSSVQVTEWYNPALMPQFEDYDLVMFPRDYISDPWPLMNWMAPLSQYVRQGGQVLLCGRQNYDLPGTLGLMKGSQYFVSHFPGDPQTTLPASPKAVFTDVPWPLVYEQEMSAIYYNPFFFQPWVSSIPGAALLGVEPLERGRTAFLSYDYQQSGVASRRLLLNLVRWMSDRYMPDWVQPTGTQLTALPGQTQSWPLTFITDSLATGTYHHSLFFSTNDPAAPAFHLPVKVIVVAAPQAQFTSNKTFTCNGKVAFQSTTLNAPTSHTWHFGDGGTSTLAAPVHQYTTSGTYDVRLIACNALGCDTLLRKNQIVVDLGGTFCDTLLIPTNQSRRVADECSGVIYDAGGPSGNYSNNQAGQVLIKTDPGTRIRLRVDKYMAACCSDYLQVFDGNDLSAQPLYWNSTTTTAPITVQSKSNELLVNFTTDNGQVADGFSIQYTCGTTFPPLAQFVYTPYNCANFIAFQSTSLDAEKIIWDFGDNTTSTQVAPIHVYKQTGTYPVTLYAIRGTDTSSYTQPVTISQVSFYADISYPAQGEVNKPITFSVTSPFPISSIYWEINGQGASGLFPVVVTFPQPGIYPVRVNIQPFSGCTLYQEGQITIGLTDVTPEPFEGEKLDLRLSPVPTAGLIHVQISGTVSGPTLWTLHDQLGRVVLKGTWADQGDLSERLDLSGLSDGLYYLKVQRGAAWSRGKIVKAASRP